MSFMNKLMLYQFPKGSKFEALNPILTVLNNILIPIIIVLASVGVIYAIYLGVMMAKAENAEKREEAKKRIINAVIAIAITLALILIMEVFVNNADKIVGFVENEANTTNSGTNTGTSTGTITSTVTSTKTGSSGKSITNSQGNISYVLDYLKLKF